MFLITIFRVKIGQLLFLYYYNSVFRRLTVAIKNEFTITLILSKSEDFIDAQETQKIFILDFYSSLTLPLLLESEKILYILFLVHIQTLNSLQS